MVHSKNLSAKTLNFYIILLNVQLQLNISKFEHFVAWKGSLTDLLTSLQDLLDHYIQSLMQSFYSLELLQPKSKQKLSH